jgi:HK97 family phage major capsid protein
MKITPKLKQWLVENVKLAADAADEAVKAAVAEAMVAGKLTSEKYAELAADEDADEADDLAKKLDEALSLMKKSAEEKPAGKKTTDAKMAGVDMGKVLNDEGDEGDKAAGEKNIRVKGAWERYSATKSAPRYPAGHTFAGQEVHEGDGTFPIGPGRRAVQGVSQRDKACIGAYIKWSLGSCKGLPASLRMNDHDKELLTYALKEMEWGGVIGSDCTGSDKKAVGLEGTKLTDWQQKALIDDSTSGGLEAAPIVFDDMVILTPLLFGEFFPAVNVVPLTRGRRVEGVSIGNVTLSSGGADDTNISLFTTTSFIAAFDTTIFVVNGAIEIGLDFLSDSPIDITGIVTEQYGRRLLTWLDEQICIGDGTTEPEGITVASGTTSVSGGSAAPTVGVYESFFFGVTKAYKQGYPNERIMFGANETTYSRARAIAVGASDARRIFGMTHGDYMLMGHKYGISTAMANTQAFFANMARYRMYRRLGLTVKATTEGQTLVRKNLLMISARSRWGGQLEDGAAAAYSSTMQA